MNDTVRDAVTGATHHHDTGALAVATAKAAPPVAVSSWYLLGHPLEHWVVAATFVYTLLLIVHQLYKMYRDFTRRE